MSLGIGEQTAMGGIEIDGFLYLFRIACVDHRLGFGGGNPFLIMNMREGGIIICWAG